MSGLSDEWERIVLDILFGPTTLGVADSGSVPATYYIGLLSSMPSDLGGDEVEISGSGYSRVEVANTSDRWGAATTTGGVTSKTNAFPVTFPTATSDYPAPVIGYGVYSSFLLESGTLVTSGNLSASKTIHSGDIPNLAAGAIIIRVD